MQSQINLNAIETFDGVTYLECDSRVKHFGIEGIFGTSNVAASSLRNENANDRNVFLFARKKKYIFIGDSYGAGLTPEGTIMGWCERVKKNLGLEDKDCMISCIGGSGFCVNTTFLDQLKRFKDDIGVTDIVVCGGYNDNGCDYNSIYNAVTEFVSYAKNHFPMARVGLGFIAFSTQTNGIELNLGTTKTNYENAILENGGWYMTGVENSLLLTSHMASDGFHPNEDGMSYLAKMICNGVLTGTCNPSWHYVHLPVVNSNLITKASGTESFGISYENGWCSISTQSLIRVNMNSYNYGYANGEYIVPLFKMPMIKSSFYKLNNTHVNVLIQNGGKYYSCGGILTIDDTIGIRLQALSENGMEYLNLSDITEIVIPPFNMIFRQLWS
jgi:hypothetical protein